MKIGRNTFRRRLPASCGSLLQGAPGVERMVPRNIMTIHIPDALARGLEGIAAAQQKSVEQVGVGVEKMKPKKLMTIHIADALARGLEGIAAVQQRSVEQVGCESSL